MKSRLSGDSCQHAPEILHLPHVCIFKTRAFFIISILEWCLVFRWVGVCIGPVVSHERLKVLGQDSHAELAMWETQYQDTQRKNYNHLLVYYFLNLKHLNSRALKSRGWIPGILKYSTRISCLNHSNGFLKNVTMPPPNCLFLRSFALEIT